MPKSAFYKATEQDEGMRLDALLANLGVYASRSAAVHAIEEFGCTVNAADASKKTIIHAGDAIVYTVPDEGPRTVIAQDIPLDIRYEDEHLLVISKQKNLVCHPSPEHPDNTLVNALIYHCGRENLCDVQGDEDRLGLVHRLDMDTTGLMIAAKSNEAGAALMEDIREKEVDRYYLALVHGIISPDTGMIDAPIIRSPKHRIKMCVSDSASARPSVTSFKVLERFQATAGNDGYTFLECKLYTGRTHQIRVHMEYIRHPIVGDPLYTSHAPKNVQASRNIERQFLHSYKLDFVHPITGEHLSFEDPLPDDLSIVLEGLRAEHGITG